MKGLTQSIRIFVDTLRTIDGRRQKVNFSVFSTLYLSVLYNYIECLSTPTLDWRVTVGLVRDDIQSFLG
jgi:hypothetical protein